VCSINVVFSHDYKNAERRAAPRGHQGYGVPPLGPALGLRKRRIPRVAVRASANTASLRKEQDASL